MVQPMPTLNDIQRTVLKQKNGAQDNIRREYLKDLSEHSGRDTIIYFSAFTSHKGPGLPFQYLALVLEDVQGFMAALCGLKRDNLDLIIHSPGGSMEATEQIVHYLRAKYNHIRAIIPQNAMSAATMMACACNEIIMGKHSAIGPIDAQLSFDGFSASVQAVLDEFEQAKKEMETNKATIPLWVSKFQSYPPGFLRQCQIISETTHLRVGEWLNNYMFADLDEKDRPGKEIAQWLANSREHRTHGRPLTIAQCIEKGLRVKALEDDQVFQEKVLSVFHAAMVTFSVMPCVKIIENHDGKGMQLIAEVAGAPKKQ